MEFCWRLVVQRSLKFALGALTREPCDHRRALHPCVFSCVIESCEAPPGASAPVRSGLCQTIPPIRQQARPTDFDSAGSQATAERAARSNHHACTPDSIALSHEPHGCSTIRRLILLEGPPRPVAARIAGVDNFAREPPASGRKSKVPTEVSTSLPRWRP